MEIKSRLKIYIEVFVCYNCVGESLLLAGDSFLGGGDSCGQPGWLLRLGGLVVFVAVRVLLADRCVHGFPMLNSGGIHAVSLLPVSELKTRVREGS